MLGEDFLMKDEVQNYNELNEIMKSIKAETKKRYKCIYMLISVSFFLTNHVYMFIEFQRFHSCLHLTFNVAY